VDHTRIPRIRSLITFGETLLFQMNTLESVYQEVSDIYDSRGARGVTQNVIKKLPFQPFNSSKMSKLCSMSCCSICFQVRNILVLWKWKYLRKANRNWFREIN